MTSAERTPHCAQARPLLGMAALGRLTPPQSVALQAHLDGCRLCAAEIRRLRATAALLDRADPDRVAEQPPRPPARLGEAVLARVAAERRRARRRTVLVGGGLGTGIAAAVMGVLLTTSVPDGSHPRTPQVAYSAGTLHATAYLTDHGMDTGLKLQVRGLPEGESYLVWLERADGSRVPAGSFTALGDRHVTVELTAAMRAQGAVALGLSTAPGGPPVLRAPVVPAT